VVQARRERKNDEAGEEAATRRKARQVIEGAGEGEDPAVAAVLRALEQCVFLGMRRQEFHGDEMRGRKWVGGREGGREYAVFSGGFSFHILPAHCV